MLHPLNGLIFEASLEVSPILRWVFAHRFDDVVTHVALLLAFPLSLILCTNFHLYYDVRKFEGRKRCFVRIHQQISFPSCEPTVRPADGNGAVAMSREKLMKSCTMVQPKSRATKCAIALFFDILVVLKRWMDLSRATLSHATPAKGIRQ